MRPGDSQWYIEAAANWFSALQNPNIDEKFLEAESLVRLPHVALRVVADRVEDLRPQPEPAAIGALDRVARSEQSDAELPFAARALAIHRQR